MENSPTRALLAASVIVALAACGGSGSGLPAGGATAPLHVQSHDSGDASAGTLSGQYVGTIVDSVRGKEKATIWLAQTQSALGGHIGVAGSSALNDEVAWVASGKTVSGYSATVESSGYCTFSMSGKYYEGGRRLKGSYSASYGCSGETGTFTFVHKCYFKGMSGDVRHDLFPKPC